MTDREPPLSAEELAEVRYCYGLHMGEGADQRVLMLLAEHAALTAELQESRDECDDHIHAVAEKARERNAAEVERDIISASLDDCEQLLAATDARADAAQRDLAAEKKRSAFLEEELDMREESRDQWHERCVAAEARGAASERLLRDVVDAGCAWARAADEESGEATAGRRLRAFIEAARDHLTATKRAGSES